MASEFIHINIATGTVVVKEKRFEPRTIWGMGDGEGRDKGLNIDY
jgi:hypothetical protein